MFLYKEREGSGRTAGTERTDGETAAKIPMGLFRKAMNLVIFPSDGAEAFDEHLPFFGGNDTAGYPVKEGNAEILLQLADSIA